MSPNQTRAGRRRGRGAGILAGAALAALALGAGAAAKPDDKPKPKPKLELLTTSQEDALQKKAIKIAVDSKRGKRARAEAVLTVDGFPDDFVFKLGPESKRLRRDEAKLKFKLSARKREVLEFAAQACDKATVEAEARAGRRTGTLEAKLRPEAC